MTISVRQVIGIVGGLMLAAATASAQSIRGTVVDPADRPIPGVVVQLLDSSAAIVGRSLTNERGEFRLATLKGGLFRLRTMRIGYRPVTSDVLALVNGAELTPRLVFAGVPFSIDTVRVVSRSVCKMRADSAAATFAVWEQVRAALNATQLTGATTAIVATTVVYERSLDRGGRRVLRQKSDISSDFVTQPWRSMSPDTLRKQGYVVQEDTEGGASFYAPGIDMLMSTLFIDDHCFRLTNAKDTTRIGIYFEPTRERRDIAEIKGTLWLDRKSNQLRTLEYRYVNIPVDLDVDAGGEMEFAAMRNGTWAISRWNIHMPVLAKQSRTAKMGGETSFVAEFKVTGGELALVQQGADTLWSRPTVAFTGIVLDSASGAPLSGARVSLAGMLSQALSDTKGRFSISGVLPGEYAVETRTTSLDSVSAMNETIVTFTDATKLHEIRVPTSSQIMATFCGIKRSGAPGVVVGTVSLRDDSTAPPSMKVFAEWKETVLQGTSGSNIAVNTPTRWLETRTNLAGAYRLCGVPVNTALSVKVEPDTATNAAAPPVLVRIPPDGRFARADLVLDKNAPRVAIFSGVVVSDSAKLPIPNVEITIPELSFSVLTNEKGEFRLYDIPAGPHRVLARRLGYGPADATIIFPPFQTIERQIILGRTVVLGEVKVMATDRRLLEFENNRKLGFGKFLDRAQLKEREKQSFMAILNEIPGMQMVRGLGKAAWPATNRRTRGARVTPSEEDFKLHAANPACYSDVFVDGMRVYWGRDGEDLFDVNRYNPDQIEALEYYVNRHSTPMRYDTGRDCGALVITLRR